jgi:hypothetical protein
MSNISEIDDALSAAINSLAAAQAVLRKSRPGSALDILRKADHVEPGDGYDPARRSLGISPADAALEMLADAERRMTVLEARKDLENQYTPRKTVAGR